MKKFGLIGLILVLIIAAAGVSFLGDNNNNNAMENDKMEDEKMMNEDKDMMDEDKDMMDEDKDMMDEDKDMMEEDKDMMKDDAMDDDMTHVMMNEGPEAPNFELMSLNGNEVKLDSLKGEKVYVKFWASWCSICLAGLDDLDKLSMSEDITVYTVVAPGEKGEKDKADFIEWFEGLGYENIEVLFDEDGDIQKEYGIRGFPTAAYIGSDGVLVKVLPGHQDNNKILEAFDTIQ
jgi:thiol-disulfide isomerase/thioredoxin